MPLPLLPPVMVIQDAPLAAVQEQPEDAVTFTLPLPPAEVNEALNEESEYVQGAPLCDTVNVCPAIVIVALSGLVLVFTATE